MSALFPDLRKAVNALRTDRLTLIFGSIVDDRLALSDDFLANKLLAAEADAERRLHVFFEPVTIFAYQPKNDEIAALPPSARWVEEASYDYEPPIWREDWGYLVLKQSPVISVDKIIITPSTAQSGFTIPHEWIRIDKNAGHIQFVPTATGAMSGSFSSVALSMISGGRYVPQIIQIRYKAGIEDVTRQYPDLVDLVMQMAALRIVQDTLPPQSGSISADGLSESESINMKEYQHSVETSMNTLRQALHGPRLIVL